MTEHNRVNKTFEQNRYRETLSKPYYKIVTVNKKILTKILITKSLEQNRVNKTLENDRTIP